MRTCWISQAVGRGGGKFPGDISIISETWNELPLSLQGDLSSTHPATLHPSILPAWASARCCAECKEGRAHSPVYLLELQISANLRGTREASQGTSCHHDHFTDPQM